MKIIRDPVHGYMEVDTDLLPLLDSPPVQRLRHIKQLGFDYLVYPGANHSRFEHSLGTMHLARLMCGQLSLDKEDAGLVTAAALLHDVGHTPYSHVLEQVMREMMGREHDDVRDILCSGPLNTTLRSIDMDPAEVSEIISGDHRYADIIHGDLDVDRMDYLMRDAHYTGVPYGTVDAHRLIRTTIMCNDRLVLTEAGISAAESLLIARTLMRPSVYYHHVSRIATCMFVRAVTEELAKGAVNCADIISIDDACLMRLLLSSGDKVVSSLAERVYSRKLYKRTVYAGPEEVNSEALSADLSLEKTQKVGEEIAEMAGVDPHEVLVDIPEIPREMSVNIQVRGRGDRIAGIGDFSPLLKMLNMNRKQQWRLGVYTPEEHSVIVEKAAAEVLNIRKPTTQKHLINDDGVSQMNYNRRECGI